MWWKRDRNGNMGQWSQGSPPPPDSTPPSPESIKKPSSTLCSTLLLTSLCKTNSPASPLALPSGAAGVLSGPEEVEVVAVGVRGTECIVCECECECEYVSKMCVTGMNADVSVLLAWLTAQCYQHLSALLQQQRRRRKGKPLRAWHLTTDKECSHLIAKC